MTFRQWIYRTFYMHSLGWRLTKILRKQKYCQKCGSTDRLHLHHEEYKWHGKHPILTFILPNLSDRMKTLCARCHRLAHQNGKL